MTLIILAIAIVVFLLILALVLPQQGSRASNRPVDRSHQLPTSPLDSGDTSFSNGDRASQSAGQNYLVPETQTVHPPARSSGNIDEQIRELIQTGQKIQAIKAIRTFTGWGLKRSKEYIDAYPNVAPLSPQGNESARDFANEASDDAKEQLRNLMDAGKTIFAIKLVRSVKGWGLREAKEYIDNYPNVPPL